MLLKLSEQIRECYQEALQARRKADETRDPEMRTSHLNAERRWLFLAHSYEFSERLSRFPRRKPSHENKPPHEKT